MSSSNALNDMFFALVIFVIVMVIIFIYFCLKCIAYANTDTDTTDSPTIERYFVCKTLKDSSLIFIFRSNSREVYIVSNYTANGPVIDNTEDSNLPIITHNERDFYVVETQDRGNQRRILIPVRSVTPPPSYDELFNDK